MTISSTLNIKFNIYTVTPTLAHPNALPGLHGDVSIYRVVNIPNTVSASHVLHLFDHTAIVNPANLPTPYTVDYAELGMGKIIRAEPVKPVSQQRSIQHLRWNASQGHVKSMLELIERPETTPDEKAWWKYKSEGGKAFTPESIEYQGMEQADAEPCPTCHGKGWIDESEPQTTQLGRTPCKDCSGTGEVQS